MSPFTGTGTKKAPPVQRQTAPATKNILLDERPIFTGFIPQPMRARLMIRHIFRRTDRCSMKFAFSAHRKRFRRHFPHGSRLCRQAQHPLTKLTATQADSSLGLRSFPSLSREFLQGIYVNFNHYSLFLFLSYYISARRRRPDAT